MSIVGLSACFDFEHQFQRAHSQQDATIKQVVTYFKLDIINFTIAYITVQVYQLLEIAVRIALSNPTDEFFLIMRN